MRIMTTENNNKNNEEPMCYPFSAIIGQENLKLCLILCAIDPSIGGVLIRGDKGTAKSTAARGIACLLPPIEVAYDPKSGVLDPYNRDQRSLHTLSDTCGTGDGDMDDAVHDMYTEVREISTPFVDLPIGATEDRVLGSIDFSATLKEGGKRVFAPGLLAAANRGILYVDEVNLLPAHLVDVLLDAAAMGVNTVQREGVSISHPANFVLIGTMNPEEGDLRPQLLDRFGLMVDVVPPRDAKVRAEVVRQRIAFERDNARFQAQWKEDGIQLAQKIQGAKDLLSRVTLSDDSLLLISRICTELKVGSLRADITLYKTATALAAWEERTVVEAADIFRASEWVLAHRRRRQPFDSPQDMPDTNKLMEQLMNNSSEQDQSQGPDQSQGQDQSQQQNDGTKEQQDSAGNTSGRQPPRTTGSNDDDHDEDQQMQTFTASKPEQIKKLKLDKRQNGKPGTGKRNLMNDRPKVGHYTRSMPTDKPINLALDATLRAAASNGLNADTGMPIIYPDNWRQKVCSSTTDTLLLFVVDASGSMSARQRMESVKGAVLALLTDAYQQRDRVCVIAFRGPKAEVLLQPTKSVEQAGKQLQRLPTGGRTPLAHALSLTKETIHRIYQQDPEQAILLIVLSDGKANVPLPESPLPHDNDLSWAQTEQVAKALASLAIPTLFLDTDAGVVRVGRGQELAGLLEASYLRLDDLSADGLVHTIRQAAS